MSSRLEYREATAGALMFEINNDGTPMTGLMINSFGQVGIGTERPTKTLTIQSPNDAVIKLITGSANKECGIEFVNNSTSTTYGGDNYIDWKIYTGNTTEYNGGESFNIGKNLLHQDSL